MAFQSLASANSVKTTGAQTPADALGATKRMSTLEDDGDSSDDHACPTCSRSFNTAKGMRLHHGKTHGENLRAEVECAWCGDSKRIPFYKEERHDRFFCDKSCRGSWDSANRSGPDSELWRAIETECAWCDDTIHVPRAEFYRSPRHFCDRECQSEWLSEEWAGEDHPQWSGGVRAYYGPSWPKQRAKARSRDYYKCRICGETDDEHIARYGRALHVHHIRRFGSFDDHEEANRLDNLLTLCQDCHSKWEGIPLRPEVVG